jgi:hypothetical protein
VTRHLARLGAAALAASVVTAAGAGAEQAGALRGTTVREALERLRAQGLNVIYSSQLVRPEMRVAVEPAGPTPRAQLESLLAPHGLAVQEGVSGVLMVVRAPPAAPAGGAIRGLVRAADTGAPIPGVLLSLLGAERGVYSRADGRFEIVDLRPGTYELRAAGAGYGEVDSGPVAVAADAVVEIVVELSPQPRFLHEVVVSPSRHGFLHRQPETRQFLDRAGVERLPHLADDAFRVTHWLPGVAAGDISAEVAIRGGTFGEVAVVLDGMDIHDPLHMRDFLSLFSIIDSEMLAGVDLFTGGFPVEFGDSLSGVMEIAPNVSDRSRYAVGASGVVARALAEGVLGDGRGSWLVSLRRGYLDWVLGWVRSIDEEAVFVTSPEYWDLFATVRFPLGERTLLAADVLASRDDLDVEDTDDRESAIGDAASNYVWLTATTDLGGGVSARTLLSYSGLARDLRGATEPGAPTVTEVTDSRSFAIAGLKQDWALESGRHHLFKWGVELRRVRGRYDHDALFVAPALGAAPGTDPQVTERHSHLDRSGTQLAVYTADRFRLAPGVTLEAGVRWDAQSWTAGSDQMSPRLNLVWETAGLGTVRAAWGRFAQAQAIDQLQVEDGLETFFPAEWAEHRILSWERALPSGPLVRVDAYHKLMADLRPRFENLFEPLDLFPQGEPDRVRLDPEGAQARGVEILVKGPARPRWSWWASYSLAAVEDRLAGAWQPRSWDQRHALAAGVSVQAGRGWTLSLAGLHHSGWPMTPVTGAWGVDGDGAPVIVPVVGERNAGRYPAYQRVDLRVSREATLRHGRLRLWAEVMNLADHGNPRSTSEVTLYPLPGGSIGVAREYENWIPILPTVGFTWEF